MKMIKAKRMTLLVLLACGACIAGWRVWADDKKDGGKTGTGAVAQRLLAANDAVVSYAHKRKYGSGIDDMWLGYNQKGEPVVGVAARKTKTYAKATALIAVTKNEEGGYKIAAAEIPTIKEFHGRSQDLTRDALKDITGRVFDDNRKARELVNAVTGATKYYKAIYVSYALMASKVIEEFESKPDWPRKTLSRSE